MREPNPIVLKVTKSQIAHVLNIHVSGGHLTLQQKLAKKFTPLDAERMHYEIALDDQELGELFRQMGYGGGGWQNALTRCFRQAIERYLGWL